MKRSLFLLAPLALAAGLLIGVGITSQTLRGAIMANIKEFASLRALGVGMGSLNRIVTFYVQLDQPTSIDSIALWCSVGDPGDKVYAVDLELSDDAGHTFGTAESESLGASGGYRTRPEWRAQGMFDAPGLIGRLTTSIDADFRISAIKINDPKGGRSRV